eukprot:1194374-Prorocentrum_minimum.AAC.2
MVVLVRLWGVECILAVAGTGGPVKRSRIIVLVRHLLVCDWVPSGDGCLREVEHLRPRTGRVARGHLTRPRPPEVKLAALKRLHLSQIHLRTGCV